MSYLTKDLVNIGRFTDISTVRTDSSTEEVEQMINIVKKYNCICASPMPWITQYVVSRLEDTPSAVVTGVVGFPSGGESTSIKVFTAKEMLAVGCKELDMVINVSALKAGRYQTVEDDIKAVVEAADGIPVKTILEICYLTDDEIARGSEIGIKAAATFIKAGTG